MNTIKMKILMIIMLSLISVSAIIGIGSIQKSTDIIEKNTVNYLKLESVLITQQLSNHTDAVEEKVESLALAVANDVDMTKMKTDPSYPALYTLDLIPIVTDFAESGKINVDCYVNFLNEYSRDGYLIGPNVINPDGNGFRRVNFETKVADMEANPDAYDWYYKPIALQHGYWTAPYFDTITKIYMISYVTPIWVDGKIVGVVGMDIRFDDLVGIVNEAQIFENGYAVLVDPSGHFLVHPKFDFNQTFRTIEDGALSWIADYYESHDEGVLEYDFEGQEKFLAFSHMPNGNLLFITVDKAEVLKDNLTLQHYVIFSIVIALLIASLLSLYLSSIITKPIRKLKDAAIAIENGEYSRDLNITSSDEIGQFAKTFSSMAHKLIGANQNLMALHEDLTQTEEELRAQYDNLIEHQEALQKSEERYRLAIEGANDVIWEIDFERNEIYLSDKLTELTGITYDSSITIQAFSTYLHPDDLEKNNAKFQKYLAQELDEYAAEYRLKKRDGDYIWLLSKGKALWDLNNHPVRMIGSFSDIDDKRKYDDNIQYMAYTDSLTGIPNRAYFIESINTLIVSAIRSGTNGAVLFIDIDNFKNINDTLGHSFGDDVLIHCANNIAAFITSDDIFCRLGGDEFVIVHPFKHQKELNDFTVNILNVFKSTTMVNNKPVNLTASIGIAVYPIDGTNLETILMNSDVAMYHAKRLGKNRYECYNETLYRELERKTQIERILHHAIDDNLLSIHYQPQYDIQTGKILGFEALMRLYDAELGHISPMEFIPIAESNGLIVKLDQWILLEASKQAMLWEHAGYDIKRISINVSAVDMQQLDFIDETFRLIEAAGMTKNFLELEITETTLMQNIDDKLEIMNRLRHNGIRITLDDFGTGFSSLNYLRVIPINTLKIDKSFIDNIMDSAKEKAIIESIIQMAHGLNLSVIAEGVETREQLELLKEKACDYVQGYYFSKPLPASEIEVLLKNNAHKER